MSAAVRTLNWYESQEDNKIIASNGWRFQVAKSVATGTAKATYNMVWQSRGVAPKTTIAWRTEYALNWTADAPSDGIAVTIGGDWQKCDKGDSYDIGPDGYWLRSKSQAGATPGWLNVGNVDYTYDGVLGIHIVVGVMNSKTGEWDPVFVDGTQLPRGSSAKYQPQEKVSWWLEGGDQTGQVFRTTKSRSTTWDFTNPSDRATNTYEWSTSFAFVDADWTVTAGPPKLAVFGPPRSMELAAMTLGGKPPVLIQLDPSDWIITFAGAVLSGAALTAIANALYNKLRDSFSSLSVVARGTDGSTIRFSYRSRQNFAQGTVAFLGIPMGATSGPVETINGALLELQAAKAVPANESWHIDPNSPSASNTLNGALPVHGGNPEAGANFDTSSFNQTGFQDSNGFSQTGFQENNGFSQGGFQQVGFKPVDQTTSTSFGNGYNFGQQQTPLVTKAKFNHQGFSNGVVNGNGNLNGSEVQTQA